MIKFYSYISSDSVSDGDVANQLDCHCCRTTSRCSVGYRDPLARIAALNSLSHGINRCELYYSCSKRAEPPCIKGKVYNSGIKHG